MKKERLEGVVSVTTTEESIDETVGFVESAQGNVLRVAWYPPIDRDKRVIESLFRAIGKSKILEIFY